MGEIVIAKIGRVAIPIYESFERINTTYKGAGLWKQLSPMNLGPFEIVEPLAENVASIIDGKTVIQPIRDYYPNGVLPGFQYAEDQDENGKIIGYQSARCESFEAYWQQCGKVYKHDIDNNGIIKKSFYERRAKGLTMSLQNSKPGELRRAFPKAKYGVPVTSYYNGQFMDWVTSRIQVYSPYYAELVSQTEAYKKLQEKIKNGKNLQLLDPDGFDYGILDKHILTKALHSTERPFGHSMVIACLLLGCKVWELVL